MNPAASNLQLRDIHLPDAVSWWPPAPGWWLLLGGLLLALLFIRVIRPWWRKRQRRRLLPQLARRELDRIIRQHQQEADTLRLVQGISMLLRRIAISYLPREEAAASTGDARLEQLNQLVPQQHFDAELAQWLLHAPYQRQADVDVQRLIQATRNWIGHLPARTEP